jgi:ribokinase
MIIVFGSINIDLVTRVERFPKPGETVDGSTFAIYPGGKGANQALAAARAGAKVRMIGAVGHDAFADPALALLVAGGIDVSGVARIDGATGCATILVDVVGENCIAVIAGANAHANPARITDEELSPSTLLVLQQEVPAEANAAILRRAHRFGARTLLNAAPARPVSSDLLQQLDFLVVNEIEAVTLGGALGWPVAPEPFALAAVGSHAGLTVVVTLGAQGALMLSGNAMWRADAPAVHVVDTTAAGDAFVGALAAALERGDKLSAALRFAVAAGSLACTARGTQGALPERNAIDALLHSVTMNASDVALP